MELVINPAQPFTADMGVNLGRRDLAVPEHKLNGPEVGPPFKEMGRKRVPQDVRADLGRNPGCPGVPFQKFPKPLPRERPAPASKEQRLGSGLLEKGTDLIQILSDCPASGPAQGNDPFFSPFSPAEKKSLIHIHVLGFEGDEFGNPESGTVKDFEHRLVPDALGLPLVRCGQQDLDLLHG